MSRTSSSMESQPRPLVKVWMQSQADLVNVVVYWLCQPSGSVSRVLHTREFYRSLCHLCTSPCVICCILAGIYSYFGFKMFFLKKGEVTVSVRVFLASPWLNAPHCQSNAIYKYHLNFSKTFFCPSALMKALTSKTVAEHSLATQFRNNWKIRRKKSTNNKTSHCLLFSHYHLNRHSFIHLCSIISSWVAVTMGPAQQEPHSETSAKI